MREHSLCFIKNLCCFVVLFSSNMSRQLSLANYLQRNQTSTNSILPNPNSESTEDRKLIEIGNNAVAKLTVNNHGRKRGSYNVLTPEERAKIGRCASETGNTKAAKIFNVPESSVRYYKKMYQAKLNNMKDPDKVTKLEHNGRGRPLLLGKLDVKVQDYVKKLRVAGGIVNKNIVMAVAKGIVLNDDPFLLKENGGRIKINKPWAQSLLVRMKYVRRKGTKAARHLPTNFTEIKFEFMERLKQTAAGLPPELIINFDQTGLKLVPTSNWTLSAEGEKQVPIIAIDDKRENTVLISITMSGTILPPQLIYAGKTDRCHPDVPFPRNWNITHSPNHWSNTDTMVEYANKVLVPYVSRVRRMHGLPNNFKALAIFDVFAAHRTDRFLQILKEANIQVVFIPPGCTGELQPLDVGFNDIFKKNMKEQFIEFYSKSIKDGLDAGKELADITVDLSTSKMKYQNARWLVKAIGQLMLDKDMIRNAWKKAAISDNISDQLVPLPEGRPGLFEIFDKN